MRTYRRIIVPVDGSPTSNKALVAALNIARDGDGRVRLIHAIDELAFVTGFEAGGEVLAAVREGGERVLAEAAEIAKAAGVNCETMLIDKPGQRLGESVAGAAKMWNADLIVVGTHGRRGIERVLLGSGAEQIIRLAPIPVLVIRGDEEQ
jgi:nucleotide-binding universal stress UspA family protein